MVEEPEPDIETAPSYLARLVGGLWALNALVLVFSFWQAPYYLTLVSAFRFQMVVTLWLLALPAAILFRRRRGWLFLALPGVISLTFLGYFLTLPVPAEGRDIKLAVANVLGPNPDMGELIRWAKSEDPDVLGLLEVRQHHLAQLETLGYKYQTFHPQSDNFGVGLASKIPPDRVVFVESRFPSLIAIWNENTEDAYRVMVAHPVPPVSAEAREVGDLQVNELIAHYSKDGVPLLVIGDLNATGWDQRLVPAWEAGLKEARTGHGLLATWPVQYPVMRIPIDHILLPKDWFAVECRRGPDIGSDHFPLCAVVRRPETP